MDQITDAFRAAGFTPDETRTFATAVSRRISELDALKVRSP
jgi:hypothetical protein